MPMPLFQFLCGAIKRRSNQYNRFWKNSFNSYVVRLKLNTELKIENAEYGFNSYVVRLKADRTIHKIKDGPLFQFLCGAIKSM